MWKEWILPIRNEFLRVGVKVRNRYKFRLIIKRKGRILFTRQTGKCDEKQAGPAIFT